MAAQTIRVRCPLCGMVVDPRRFEESPHSFDFKVIEFFGSPKGRRGGGLRHLKVNILALQGGYGVYHDVKRKIIDAVEKIGKRFREGTKWTFESLVAGTVSAGSTFGSAAGEVTWK